jgi:hypothetical protein
MITTEQIPLKEFVVAHIVRIQNREQFIKALRVLDKLPGIWHSRGPAETPVLLVLDSHYNALVKAGVLSANGKEENARGEKTASKKAKS